MDELDALDQATRRYRKTETAHEQSREETIKAVVTALRAGKRPTDVTARSPFTAAYVRRIARLHGVEPARPTTTNGNWPMNTFTGVLAVINRTTPDGRRLAEPTPELTRPLPLNLRRPDDYTPAGGITRVWRDGDLIRYAGTLNYNHPEADKIAAEIRDGKLVGMLDADGIPADGMRLVRQGHVLSQEEVDALPLDADVSEFETVMSGWRVVAATLLPPEEKAWPEVTLALDTTEKS